MTAKEQALEFGCIWLPRQNKEVNMKFHKLLSQEIGKYYVVLARMARQGKLKQFKADNE